MQTLCLLLIKIERVTHKLRGLAYGRHPGFASTIEPAITPQFIVVLVDYYGAVRKYNIDEFNQNSDRKRERRYR